MPARLDHLVVAAASLAEGAAWCEATLGVAPNAGGEHPRMGTHNQVLRIATVDHPLAYLEIIAVQPGREPQAGRRWFDLDDEAVRDRLRRDGPRLLAWAARVDDLPQALAALQAQGVAPGAPEALSRATARGLVEWRMALRMDGRRLCEGAVPAPLQWGALHPAAALPPSGVTLQALAVRHPQPQVVQSAFEALGLEGVAVRPGPHDLCAALQTPRGLVRLESDGL